MNKRGLFRFIWYALIIIVVLVVLHLFRVDIVGGISSKITGFFARSFG